MTQARKIRWKLLLAIAIAILAALLYVRLGPGMSDSMNQTVLTIGLVMLLLLWALVWVVFVSGLGFKTRRIALCVNAGAVVLCVLLVRIDGFAGDIFPQLRWAWNPRPGEDYDPLEPDPDAWVEEVPGAVAFPEFLGPGRANRIEAQALPERWFELTPRELWRHKIGAGWSAFAVARGLAITQEQRDQEECVVAYALRSGRAVWEHRNRARFSERMGGDGPRATPTIAGDLVLALGATGILDCLELRSGEPRWSRQILEENGHANLEWGKSTSPLVARGLVVVPLGSGDGGTLAAYDLASGEPRWRAGAFESSYSSPVLRTLASLEQIVVVYAGHVAGHRVESGEVLWSAPIPTPPANVANPVVLPKDRVLVSIGYGKGSRMFQIARSKEGNWSATQLWRSLGMKPKFTNLVVAEKHAFGLDEGRLVCIDLESGKRAWRGSKWGHGQVLGVGDKLLIQAEHGEVALVEASTEEQRVLHSFQVLAGKTWNNPVLAGRYLLVRNDREAACYEYIAEE